MMKCIDALEVGAWLRENDFPTAIQDGSTGFLGLRLKVPNKHLRIEAFVRQYLAEHKQSAGFLVHVTDWSLYQPSEMFVIRSLRECANEKRSLVDAPGHVFRSDEVEEVVGMYSLAVSYRWSACLYADEGGALCCWEGEFFDFFTKNLNALESVSRLGRDFEINLESMF